jgi:ParB family chromosome partitioning protein
MLIDIEKIEVGERLRARLDLEKLRQLADDMERNGQLQEIVVAIKWGMSSRGTTIVEHAVLIAGYRRLEAAKLLGWTQIRCTRQLGGEIDADCNVDLLRAEYSENELREDFTEMERVAFGVKIKERVAAAARERMLAGKKLDYEYDPETGYKVWNDSNVEINGENDDSPTTDAPAIIKEGVNAESPLIDPRVNLPKGIDEVIQYAGGRASELVAKKIGMSDKKFRQGEYVLKHGSEEQRVAIDSGVASISGVYNELRPKQPKSMPCRDLSDKAKEEREAMLSLKEREAAECHNAFAAMTPEQKIAGLQSQLKAERCRAVTAETELTRLKDELHNAIYHKDGIISSLERQLEAANAKIQELEAVT